MNEAEKMIAAGEAARTALAHFQREEEARLNTNASLAEAVRNGATKSELARMLGVTRQTITYRIEKATVGQEA